MDEEIVSTGGAGQDQSSGVEESGVMDFDSASDKLAADMFPERNTDSAQDNDSEVDGAIDAAVDGAEISAEPEVDAAAPQDEEIEPVPKTWPKEMHEHWGKTPKEVRDYWNTREKQMLDGLEQYKNEASFGKQMRDVITPYAAMIQAQGVDAPKAVQVLLNAHYKLSVSSPEQKSQYFQQLARQYGVDIGALGTNQDDGAQVADPRYTQLQEQLFQLQQYIQSQQQAVQQSEAERISKEVNSFAEDAAHPYFNDVADDMIPFIRSGISLQEAYDKAVWANPVTRAKEQARILQEQQAESKRKAQEAVEAAKKATSANIRNRDTRRTPTEQDRGTMRNLDSVMRDVMREIKQTH